MNLDDIEFAKNNEHKLKKSFQSVCEIEGEWTNNIKFDNKKYWGIGEYNIGPFIRKGNILESDSFYRKDVQCLMQGNIEDSQKLKELYEEEQRLDRDLREAEKKKAK